MRHPLKVVLVCSVLDLVHNPFDGLAVRHADMVDRLLEDERVELTLVAFESPTVTGADVPEHRRRALLTSLPPVGSGSPSRSERLGEAARVLAGRPGGRHGRDLAGLLPGLRPDVFVTIGPYFEAEYRGVFAQGPTVHLFEEDALSRPDLGASSRAGRALRRVEEAAGRLSRRHPAHVVVIADGEQPASRRRYRAPVSTLHYALPEEFLTPVEPIRRQSDLLVMGALNSERNAAGLAAVLEELQRRGVGHVPVRLVSDGGLHPTLAPFLGLDWVEHVPSLEPAPANYDAARVALSPSTYATGIKTTILQAWAREVPVVTYAGSARTLAPSWRRAVRQGPDATTLVDEVLALWDDATARTQLAADGVGIARAHFDAARLHDQLVRLLDSAAGT